MSYITQRTHLQLHCGDIVANFAAQLKVCDTSYFDVPGIQKKTSKADKSP
jgi:hypothetical protein